jgi:hypothetical protein
MQSSQKTKGEEVMEIRSKTAGTTIKDISPSGITMELNSEAQTKGKFNAQGVATTTVVMKIDGTSTWENKGMLFINDGDMIAIWGAGTGKSTGPMSQAWEGEMHAMSQSPKLAWLNNAKLWTEGTGNRAKNESVAKIYQVK